MRAYLEDRMIALKDSINKEDGKCKEILKARLDEVIKLHNYWEEIVKGTSMDLSYGVEVKENEKH